MGTGLVYPCEKLIKFQGKGDFDKYGLTISDTRIKETDIVILQYIRNDSGQDEAPFMICVVVSNGDFKATAAYEIYSTPNLAKVQYIVFDGDYLDT